MKHYKFGGSTAHRTAFCPAWANLKDKYKIENRGGAAADRGTKLHDAMERSLLDQTVDLDQFSPGDQEAYFSAQKMVSELFKDFAITEFEPERTMAIADDCGGTGDLMAWNDEYFLIADYKFGRMHVPAEENWQMVFLHLMTLNDPELREIAETRKPVFAIIQPEISPVADVWEPTIERVQEMQEHFLKALDNARKGGEPVAGDHCDFCPSQPYCSIKRKEAATVLNLDPKKDLVAILDLVPSLKSLITAVEGEAVAALEAGFVVEGYTLVPKRQIKKFADPVAAAAILSERGIPDEILWCEPDVRSPAQLAKGLKAAKIDVAFDDLLDTTPPANNYAKINVKSET
jgi:hypothetical protein